MRLLAVLLTSNAALTDVIGDARLDLPTAVLRNAGANSADQLTMVAFNPDRRTESFDEFLGRTVDLGAGRQADRTYDGAVVLFAKDASHHVAEIRDAVFASEFDGYAYIENRANFLVRSFGRLFKNLFILMSTMRDKTRMEAAILPAKNFESETFREFLRICQDEAGAGDFQNQVVPALTAVTRRRRPRRRSNYPTKYFQDDQLMCFEYGHEKHSSFETGGAHAASCSIRGNFRLGVPLEQQRHFNVMSAVDGKRISGEFSICHGGRIDVVGRTHLNMFSNDFLK